MVKARRLGGWAGWLWLAGLGALGGCCHMEKPVDRGPLPGPISVGEQVDRLNRRAEQLPTLKASGRVRIDYVEDGKKHHEECDGILMLRQVARVDGRSGQLPSEVDIVLFGRFAGSDVFELGENRQWYWMAIRMDPKRAYVGEVGGPAQRSESRGGGMPFRADRVLPLLAITPLSEAFTNGNTVLMLVDDDTGVNRLLVVSTGAWAHVQRELVVDRRSGDVAEVRIYGINGIMEAVAHLSKYEPLDEAGGGGATVRVPRQIVIEYPTRQAKVELDLSSVKLAPKLLGPTGLATFTMPDFKDQGLEVIDVDRHP